MSANKRSSSDLNLSSHINFPLENCCFVEYSVTMNKRTVEYQKYFLQDMSEKSRLMKLLNQ